MNLKAALIRPLIDWRKLLVASILTLLPPFNIMVLGYAIRTGLTFTEAPYQLPPWKPIWPLFRDGLVAIGIIGILSLPCVIFITISQIVSRTAELPQYAYLVPPLYLIILSYIIPALMLLVFSRPVKVALAQLIPTILQPNYLLAMTTGYLVWILLSVAATGISFLLAWTFIIPFVLLGATTFVGTCLIMSLTRQTFK